MYKQSGWMKSKALLASLLLVVGVTVGGTLAYIVAGSGPVENEFTPSKVTTAVVESFDGTTKSDVKIRNTGDTTAYIRAAVVVTWQNEDGNVYGQKPVEKTDYDIEWNLNNGWKKAADGFYYWTSPVKSDDEDAQNCYTGVLIESCEPNDNNTAPKGYSLAVEIIGSGIQSVPTSVVAAEWSSGVSSVADDGALNIIKEGDAQ
ncbi:MAG: hypothetical protein IJE29_06305 [Firmicutes bacterium]|nr:hypothetical protein [Bacillota bacterium]